MTDQFIKISPNEFKNAFSNEVIDKEKQLLSEWSNWKKYTYLMLGTKREPGILSEVAKKLGLNYFKDYWTLDAIFYKEKDIVNFDKKFTFAKYLAVVIEHENAIETSFEEINKLTIFNSPLKVLITYPVKDINNYLTKYSEIVSNGDVFNDISNLRRQMVIFGTKNQDSIKWGFYIYRNGNFEDLH